MKRTSIALLLSASLISSHVSAQDMDMSSADDSTSASDDVETATLLAYLGLSAVEGKATINDGTGKIEGQMLGAAMAWKAASKIVKADGIENQMNVILLSGKEKLSVSAYYAVQDQLGYLMDKTDEFTSAAMEAKCEPGRNFRADGQTVRGTPDDAGADGAKTKPFKFTATDFTGLLKTDNTLSALPITLGDNLLTNALLAHAPKGSSWKIMGEVVVPNDNGHLVSWAGRLKGHLRSYMLGQCGKNSPITEAEKKKVTAAARTLFGNVADLSKAKDGNYSPMLQARIAAPMVESAGELLTLRYEVDGVGGTLVNTSNIWTSLGMPGVTVRGGLIVTYRLNDARTGTTEAQGQVICRVPKKLLMSITRKEFDLADVKCKDYQPLPESKVRK